MEEKNKVNNNLHDSNSIRREVKDNIIEQSTARNMHQCPNMVRWTSWKPKSPFAPMWDVPLWQDTIPDFFADKILSDVKSFESQLGMWQTYNVFSWYRDYPFVNKLRMMLKTMYITYMEELGLEIPLELYIRGWFNIMEPGELLSLHSHSFHENTYLSGNLLLNDSKVSTEYVIPNYSTYGGNYLAPSHKGSLMLFPSWVEHFVPIVDEKRYCLAFDFYTGEAMEYLNDNYTEFDSMLLSVRC